MIDAIEQKLVETIQFASESEALGYRLATVASYRNELDAEIGEVVKAFPAAWVVFLGETRPQDIGADSYRVTARFAVVVAASHRRSEAAARYGAGLDIGAYRIAQDLRDVLASADMGLEGIEQIEPAGIQPRANGVFGGHHVAVYAVLFDVRYVFEVGLPDPDTLKDFLVFHADYDVEPHGNVTEPLPAAGADASDTVDIPQE